MKKTINRSFFLSILAISNLFLSNIIASSNPFSFIYEGHALVDSKNKEYEVASSLILKTHKEHSSISPLFETVYAPNYKPQGKASLEEIRVQDMIANGAIKIDLKVNHAQKPVTFYYFNHGSKQLMVCGAGLFKTAASIGVIGQIFQQYDVLIVEQDWQIVMNLLMKAGGMNDASFTSFLTALSGQLLGRNNKEVTIDTSNCMSRDQIQTEINKLVTMHIQDMTSILDWATQQKEYTSIIGNFICYSSWIALLYQHHCEIHNLYPRFNKLILSSCGESFDTFIDSIINNPNALEFSPDAKHPLAVKILLKMPGVHTYILPMLGKLLKSIAPHFSIKNFFYDIKETPILFMHGRNDQLISNNVFIHSLFNSVANKDRAASLNPYGHAESLYDLLWYYAQVTTFVGAPTTHDFIYTLVA